MGSDDDQYIEENSNFRQVINDWSEAVFNFYVNYKGLIVCIENGSQTVIKNEEIRIGQCPMSLLINVVDAMHVELEKLHHEMDTVASTTLPDRFIDYKMLAKHTATINELNQQAETRLALASLSAS